VRLEGLRSRLHSRRDDLRALRIAVLAGGSSREREVSLVSGEAVATALIDAGYQAELLGVNPDDFTFERRLSAGRQPDALPVGDGPAQALQPAVGGGITQYLRGGQLVFTTLHGTRGEDGVWQGMLELLDVPYVSAGVKGSALAMDKLVSKRLFEQLGVPTPRYWVWRPERPCRAEVPAEFTKLVAKPVAQGSSVGIAMIANDAEGWHQVEQLSAEFGTMIIEQRIQGRELTAAVIGHSAEPAVLPLVEIRPVSHEFYDYGAKYTKGETDYICPAPVPEAQVKLVQQHAATIYRELDLGPYARIDCMLDEAGVPWFLEANTLPGFTPLSLLPQAAAAAGVDFAELLELLILLAFERWEAAREVRDA